MLHTAILETMTLLCIFAVAYHHFLYPLFAAIVGMKSNPREGKRVTALTVKSHITVVMPAYNEARFIADKIANLAELDYPRSRLNVLVGCDGCSDNTADLARAAAAARPDLSIDVIEFAENRGKVSVINDLMKRTSDGICLLTDVSAMLPKDALKLIALHFKDTAVGAVGAGYRTRPEDGDTGESFYWRYQTMIKQGESRFAGLVGAHGACYAIRGDVFEPLAPDTINDDFIIPMRIGLAGYRTLYDYGIVAEEQEVTTKGRDFDRRKRIGAGNLQQFLRLTPLLSSKSWGLGLAFLSSKVLRVFMAPALMLALLGSILLASENTFFLISAAVQIVGYLLVGVSALTYCKERLGVLDKARYFVWGHIASFIGAVNYLLVPSLDPWRNAERGRSFGFRSKGTAVAKRCMDVVGASTALVLFAPLIPLIMFAIRVESQGPIFFRQMRVGRALPDQTELFEMIKFRTMYQNAESKSGPVWAMPNDPRITRVGNFLRKTRLDEIPQFVNVLRGEMSIVGPRPERPGFYKHLEEAIPYYSDRTYDLRPGITGLAQVNQGYDRDIEDVKRKVLFDHVYAASITKFWTWLKMDITIFTRTVMVMALGRGQ